ncbi:MAG: hypothetical protein RBT16_11300 [Desulfococcus multivorans]|jgi:hypothetical protein|nr:hypothetical protein [Desulfococcus multivorans]
MSENFNPAMRMPILETIPLTPPTLEAAGAEPLLDETGNGCADEEGSPMYGT